MLRGRTRDPHPQFLSGHVPSIVWCPQTVSCQEKLLTRKDNGCLPGLPLGNAVGKCGWWDTWLLAGQLCWWCQSWGNARLEEEHILISSYCRGMLGYLQGPAAFCSKILVWEDHPLSSISLAFGLSFCCKMSICTPSNSCGTSNP